MTTKFFQTLIASAVAVSGAISAANPAAAFDVNLFSQFVQTEFEALDPDFVADHQLDPTKLDLIYDHDVKVHFISEGAGYRNTLGVTTTGETEMNQLLFDDITCLTSACSTYTGYRDSGSKPVLDGGLEAGETVGLGTVAAGTNLDFWLGQNAFGRTNYNTWYGDASKNSDGLQHLMAYEFENYLVLAWEDLTGGGDKDYNDVVFAVDVGEGNLNHIRKNSASVPEPATTTGNVRCFCVGFIRSSSQARLGMCGKTTYLPSRAL